jgi:hypothetical protein
MKCHPIEHRFVHSIPSTIEPGVLYVSMEFATAIHLCCCGCGREVVTPFSPTDWKLTFDGVSISLWPSIGNWNFPCRSHYIIKANRIIEAAPWSQSMVEAERKRDKSAKAEYFVRQHLEDKPKAASNTTGPTEPKQPSNGVSKFLRWLLHKD